MDDYIRRADVIDALESTDWYHQAPNNEMVHGANSAEHQAWYKEQDVYSAIRRVPAADVVEVRHGQWIEDGYYGEPCVCSYCGEPCKDTVMGKPRWHYCPNCGARCDGGQNE